MTRVNHTTIPGVQQFKRNGGIIHYRHRKSGEPIKAPYPSPQFDTELARLNKLVEKREAEKRGPARGTLGSLIKGV
jgi:hypothetical protein